MRKRVQGQFFGRYSKDATSAWCNQLETKGCIFKIQSSSEITRDSLMEVRAEFNSRIDFCCVLWGSHWVLAELVRNLEIFYINLHVLSKHG
jgi:hypothetical protein